MQSLAPPTPASSLFQKKAENTTPPYKQTFNAHAQLVGTFASEHVRWIT